jgi:hypothetical protein
MALISGPEVLGDLMRPAVGFGEQDAAGILGVENAAYLGQESVRFRQVGAQAVPSRVNT